MNYKQQVNFIHEIDRCLDLMRDRWLSAKTKVDKDRCMNRIDSMLDQRILFMKNRDRYEM